MGAESVTDICILLVAADLTSLRKTLTLLLKAKYRVAIARNGEDALSIIQEKKRKVDLVLTETYLPDMCAFMFVQIIETEFRLPVVMICETYHEPTILRGLLNGAMYCLAKPLCPKDIEDLWQHPLIKKKDESSQSGVTDKESGIREAKETEVKLEPCESPVPGDSSRSRKRKIEAEGSSIRRPSVFVWTPFMHAKFLEVVNELGVYDATPLEILRRISTPGLTMEIVIEKLQEYRLYLKRQEELQFRRGSYFPNPAYFIAHQQPPRTCRLMGQDINTGYNGLALAHRQLPPVTGFLQNPPQQVEDNQEKTFFEWLKETGVYADPFPRFWEIMTSTEALTGTAPSLTYVLQQMSRRPSAPVVPVTNAAQRLVQPSWSSTVTGVPSLTLAPPPAHVQGVGPRGHGYQVRGPPALSLSLGHLSCPSASSEVRGDGERVSSFPDEILNEVPEKASD